ncbi:hypothetical protein BJY01DRAFT_21882 [Aspergillus pseudoustus]|uniref:Uncharacterized protein n=1 Tax=Aspergillus pseudoustus TaxID=1810923 RepID=A0ABR4JMF8_9EURO
MWPQQDEILLQSSGLKKRKKDLTQVDIPSSLNNISIIPSHLHAFNAPYHLTYTDPSRHIGVPSRLQYVPRKRRVLQLSPLYTQQQSMQTASPHHLYPDPGQSRPLSPTICVSSALDDPSPPISPKTIVIPKFPPQSHCASAPFLRPCHICHRRPTTRELLEAYADCDLCGERACFVCLRRCDAIDCCDPGGQDGGQNWGNNLNDSNPDIAGDELYTRQPRMVCSCCAVEGLTETGAEVVRCLACIK